MEPDLLVLDEPTRGVDGRRKLALVELVRTMAAQGTAVVVVTHDMDFAAEAADVVTSMAAGRVLSDRAPARPARVRASSSSRSSASRSGARRWPTPSRC